MNDNKKSGLLKFITCGSVDDGKSTLIGRMLYDSKLLYTDQEKQLKLESKIRNNGVIDYSLLLDGLMAEREQGITIDVAYRFFSTDKRSFIVADTPGHEEYTRNMAVGASFADLAVILVDITKGVVEQTMRHIRICSLMGIRYFVFLINKMDLIDYCEDAFNEISKRIIQMKKTNKLVEFEIIPISATEGDNITKPSPNTPWYEGKFLLEYLESVKIEKDTVDSGFILPVQRVCRTNENFRGYQGQVESGNVKLGDEVTILPSYEKAVVQEIYVTDQSSKNAESGQAVTIRLNREIDISRGYVISKNANLKVSKLFCATILWMDDIELVQGREFLIKIANKTVPAVVIKLKYKLDIISEKKQSVKSAQKNDIVICDLRLSENIVCNCFEEQKTMGSFILIDRISNMTSACGRIDYLGERENNLIWQNLDVTREMRAKSLGQTPITLWFTGLSGSGKSTIANSVEKELYRLGKHTILLDGDNIRMGLNNNLGFEEKDRVENIRRIAEVAKLMNDAGLIVLTAFISPFQHDRENAKRIIGDKNFIEIFISTPLDECEKRDKKGLYKKARLGEIPNFTGINSPYELPSNPDITIDTTKCSVEEAVQRIIARVL